MAGDAVGTVLSELVAEVVVEAKVKSLIAGAFIVTPANL